jgi:hypothetical protein
VLSSCTSRGASFFLTHFPWRHLLQPHRARPLLSWPSPRPLHRAAHPRQGLSTSAPDRRQTAAVTASRGWGSSSAARSSCAGPSSPSADISPPSRPLHRPTHPRWSLSSSGPRRRWMLAVAASGGRCSWSVVGPSCAAPSLLSRSLSLYIFYRGRERWKSAIDAASDIASGFP